MFLPEIFFVLHILCRKTIIGSNSRSSYVIMLLHWSDIWAIPNEGAVYVGIYLLLEILLH